MTAADLRAVLAARRGALAAAPPRPWFHVGPPWASSPGMIWTTEDPHAGRLITEVGADFDGQYGPRAIDIRATTELIVDAVNEHAALLECELRLRGLVAGERDTAQLLVAQQALGRLDRVRRRA